MNTKTALITGACGGIGSRVAKDLAHKGYQLILVDIDTEANNALAASFDNAQAVTFNLTDRQALKAFCSTIASFKLDIAFINAGVTFTGNVIDLTEEQIDLQLELNLRSAIILNRACALDMITRQSGHLINTVSLGGIAPMTGTACYSASKFGLRGFLAALYSELKPHGIKVSGIYPGAVDTPMLRYEALNNGNLLNFLSPPKTPDDILIAFNKALKSGKLEVYVPYSDSLTARLFCFFPSLLDHLQPMLEKIGARGLKAYLAKLE